MTITGLPLTSLLSQVLVANIIEFDNEFEHRSPHRTSRFETHAKEGPWLTSTVMWWNCMRFVDAKGVKVKELKSLARTTTNLRGMQRWGYIVVKPDPTDGRLKPPASDWVICATRKGQMAREVWEPLFEVIEDRWETRFGVEELSNLRNSLLVLIDQFSEELPDCLPILGYGLGNSVPPPTKRDATNRTHDHLPLSALLSKVLLALALEFEKQSDLSLAISANVVRVLNDRGTPVRVIPRLSGVSKESISMATGFMEKRGIVAIEKDPVPNRGNTIRLTSKGLEAQASYTQLLKKTEEAWAIQYGLEALRGLREALEPMVGDTDSNSSPLFRGLQPYPEGWRAQIPKPQTLPHFPMVLHRGGYPDGS